VVKNIYKNSWPVHLQLRNQVRKHLQKIFSFVIMKTQEDKNELNQDESIDEVDFQYPDDEKKTLVNRMEKSLYHNYKRYFKLDPTRQSNILFGDMPVIPINGSVDLAKLFKESVDMFWHNLNDLDKRDTDRS
jgi:hypothetical protein